MKKNKLKILKEFSSDYNKRIYGRDISDKLGMNQKTVSNTLNELEKEYILKSNQEGKNKYYSLNKPYPYLKEIINILETQRKIDFLIKYKKLHDFFNKLESRIDGMLVVFGSYANFSSNEKSDLDIFLIGKIKDVDDLEELYNIKINVVKSSKVKFDKNEHIIREIIKNHIILSGRESFIDLIW